MTSDLRLMTTALVAVVLFSAASAAPSAPFVFWGQWGRSSQHDGFAPTSGQPGSRVVANVVFDPFVDRELGPDDEGELLVHYQTPLVSGGDVFMAFKGGRFTTTTDWQAQTWGEREYSWLNDAVTLQWGVASDWEPVPYSPFKDGPRWEPVFHGVLTDAALYVPGFGGTIWNVDRVTGRAIARINPFSSIDANTYVAGPLAADAAGNVYYKCCTSRRW